MKHPSLQDISLWQLLAVINDIPTDVDNRGIPQAKLSRGSTLMLPSVEEIEDFRSRNGVKTTPFEKITKACPQCGRQSAAGAAICGACAHSFNLDKAPASTASHDAGMVVMQAAGFVNKPGALQAKRPSSPSDSQDSEIAPEVAAPLYDASAQLAVVPLDEQTRLARCINHIENPTTIVAVEVQRENKWHPVVAYEIFASSSMRHEYTPRGDRKSVKIDLPIDAILELSNNDLMGNWKNYRDRYLAQVISLNR